MAEDGVGVVVAEAVGPEAALAAAFGGFPEVVEGEGESEGGEYGEPAVGGEVQEVVHGAWFFGSW